jgi:UDP-N-acetylglucosamine 4,6-dehydratase
MTRFWIGIEQGINLVEKSFSRMIGGEIFIPIIPSIKITDLAKAMAPNLKDKIIGIRPGEKIHETMCSTDDAPYVFKFKDYYLITPSSQFYKTKKDYKKNRLKEIGKEVNLDFEYNSGTNKNFLTISEIKKMNLSNKIDNFSRSS